MKNLNESSEEFKSMKKEWMEKAEAATLETLPTFLQELTRYNHDYGTICHAIAIAAIAAAHAVDRSPSGGITGFQAGCIMWGFVRGWSYSSNKTGLRLIDYDNFLYPQYAYKYQKTIAPDIWKAIQDAAKAELKKADKGYQEYLVELGKYKKDIKAFIAKYPDYYDRKEYYDPLGMGTGEEWEAEEKKKRRGFEFAPQEPFEPVYGNTVYKHWLSIADGKVPFGYEVKEL